MTFQDAIDAIDAASIGPSNNPQPWAHAYSLPDRFTPRSRTVWPVAFTKWLPTTLIVTGVPRVGADAALAAPPPTAVIVTTDAISTANTEIKAIALVRIRTLMSQLPFSAARLEPQQRVSAKKHRDSVHYRSN
ncbi:unannotated protein [freshwater metagenome]|uniref:Unannotated protein n=1 Tax=freshwater metagenome TaxID=449393 RepID=A0A6J7VDA7_9ZZZZ